MLNKLKNVEERFNTVNELLCDGEVATDISRSTALLKELKTLTPIVEKYREYKKNIADLN